MIQVNLLPIRAEKRRESVRQHLTVSVGMILLLALVVGVVHLTLNSRVDSARKKIAQRRATIADLDKQIKVVEGYDQKKRDLKEKIAIIKSLESQQRGPAKVFHALAVSVPEKLWLEEISDTGGTLTLKGLAADNQTIADFMTTLETNALFQKVRLDVTKRVDWGGAELTSFTLKASVLFREAGKNGVGG